MVTGTATGSESGPPIATEKGWLLIYYGTKHTSGGLIYRIGSALLDLEDPSVLIGRCNIPILSPREYYERVGDVDNMVFTTGAVLDERLGNLMIYYGAATNAICLGWGQDGSADRKVHGAMSAQPPGSFKGSPRRRRGRDVIHRWEGNPLITLDDIPFPCSTVFNAAAVKSNNEYLLLLRVEDPRITELEGWFYIVYTAVSGYGPRLALARTEDFKRIERVGLISVPENKDGALFPRKIGGSYVRFDRPIYNGLGNIWISFSLWTSSTGGIHTCSPPSGRISGTATA